MKIFILILFFLLLFISVALSASPSAVKRIVGGEAVIDTDTPHTSNQVTQISQWPWVIALNDGQSQFCGASLIDKQWLMTAAHCVYDYFSNKVDTSLEITAIFLQSNLSKSNSQSFNRRVTKITVHPDYDYDLNLNDIALLKLDSPVNNINPVQLPGVSYDEFTVKEGTIATALGWGITQNINDNEPVLRKVELPITNQTICSNSLNDHFIDIEDNMICAGYKEGGKDACSGDSGGPLVYFSGTLQNWVQVGIVSFGIGCALPDLYGVYTRVSKYTQNDGFINKIICDNLPQIPNLDISQNGNTVEINFTTTELDQNFRLYYASFPQMTPIHYFDILDGKFDISLAEGETYFATAQTRNINCISPFADIQVVNP